MYPTVKIYIVLLFASALTGCGVAQHAYGPAKKFSPQQLQDDYHIYRTLLEKHHPGLYWYTPKDSMDHYFSVGLSQLNDSLTEAGFRKTLSYVTSHVNCGHTSVRGSKGFSRYSDRIRFSKMFPLSVKTWSPADKPGDDIMIITATLNRKDSLLKRGTRITSIDGFSVSAINDSLFHFLSTDGYNRTHKYQTLSNRGFFGSTYTGIFGLKDKYTVGYIDSTGKESVATLAVFDPAKDTVGRSAIRNMQRPAVPSRKEIRREELSTVRLLQLDSANHTAMMNLSSFGRNYGLRKFFRRSFHNLRKHKVDHLVIDVRGNGGGSVTNSTLLSRYMTDHRFRIGDTLVAVSKKSQYDRYVKNHFWNRLFIGFFTKKKKDGLYHFGYFERHYFSPKKRDHFDGKVYVLIGGNSFSATTLFANAVRTQDNVTLIGEETGGGAYGNSAWLIPDVTLPNTGVRFRLPMFRLVMDKNAPKTGLGVQPEIEIRPTVESVRRNADFKLEKAMELIKADKATKSGVH